MSPEPTPAATPAVTPAADENPEGRTDLARLAPLERASDMVRCEAVQRLVWGVADREVVPAGQLVAAVHAGGLVTGAFVGRELVGFSYGFPARDAHAGWGFHSHMLAVLPGRRSGGLGRELKWYQRIWCLERGIGWISWTFDPLQAANARLNLEHLGAVGERYLPDAYGRLGGRLNGELPTDRLLVRWWLERPEVAARERGGPPDPPAGSLAEAALGCDARGRPTTPRDDLEAPLVAVAAPPDLNRLLAEDPARARAWREAQRAVMPRYLARGYVAERFLEGHYLLFRK